MECFTSKLIKFEVNMSILSHLWSLPEVPRFSSEHRCAPTVLSILQQFCKTTKLKRHEANNLRFLKLKCHLLGEMGFGVEFSQVADLISFSTWSDILMLQSASDPTSNKSRKCCSSSQIFTWSGKIFARMQRKSALRRKKLVSMFFHYDHQHTNDLTQRIVLKQQHLFNANIGEYFPRK